MQQIIQHLFRVQSLEEVPRERLEELVATYPSFGIGRYLLSRKLNTEDAGHFSEETQKTNLYFSNPFWLYWLLQNEGSAPKPAYSREAPPANVIAEETMIEDEQSWGMPDTGDSGVTDQPEHDDPAVPRADLPVTEEALVDSEFPIIQEATATGITGDFFQESLLDSEAAAQPVANSPGKPVMVEEPGVREELAAAAPSAAEALLQSLEEARGLRQTLVEMNDSPTKGQEGQESVAGNEIPSHEQTEHLEQIPIHEQIQLSEQTQHHEQIQHLEQIQHPEQTQHLEQAIAGPSEAGLEGDNSGGVVGIAESSMEEAASPEEIPTLPAAETSGQTEQDNSGEAGQESAELPAAEITEVNNIEETPEVQAGAAVYEHAEQGPIVHTPEGQAAAHTLEGSVGAAVSAAAVTAQAAAPAEQIVVFEPYHTIDYFASVGIKLVLDENPSDKLGKQLKSFTDWLKVMRKLPQKNQEIVPDVAVEHQIQAIAAHSITGKDVLTETMAEVLVKQGMREKAIDVYHKLSLLNPEKSAYFATKIEQLKID